MKKLLIFGASGQTGKVLVQHALDKGNHVCAALRNPEQFSIEHPNLEIVYADMLKPETLAPLFAPEKHYDALLSCLGVYLKTPITPLAEGTENLINAARNSDCRRWVILTSLGCGDSKGQGRLIARLFTSIFFKYNLIDKNIQEKHIQDSDLDYTILRPARLMAKTPEEIGKPLIWKGLAPKIAINWQISLADVAEYMLDIIDDKSTYKNVYQMAAYK